MRQYLAIHSLPNGRQSTFTVYTQSAMIVANEEGYEVHGETIRVQRFNGVVLSKVKYFNNKGWRFVK